MTECFPLTVRRTLGALVVALVLSRGVAHASTIFLFDFEGDTDQMTTFTTSSNGVSPSAVTSTEPALTVKEIESMATRKAGPSAKNGPREGWRSKSGRRASNSDELMTVGIAKICQIGAVGANPGRVLD